MKLVLAIVAALLFLGMSFAVGYNTGAGTVNHRLDCRQAQDDQAIQLFVKLILADGHVADPGVVAQLRHLHAGQC